MSELRHLSANFWSQTWSPDSDFWTQTSRHNVLALSFWLRRLSSDVWVRASCLRSDIWAQTFQWFPSLFRCKIATSNFSMGFNIISPYMDCATHKRDYHLISSILKRRYTSHTHVCRRYLWHSQYASVIWVFFLKMSQTTEAYSRFGHTENPTNICGKHKYAANIFFFQLKKWKYISNIVMILYCDYLSIPVVI